MDTTPTAIVTRSTGSNYTLLDSASGLYMEARLRGRLRLKGVRSTNPVAVGDVVEYERDDRDEVYITGIRQRTNYVIRRSPNLSRESHIIAANMDQVALVVTLFAPEVNVEFVDRFLVTCSAYNIPATLILNKIDMAYKLPEAVDEFREIYTLAGYPIIEVSATTGENMEALREFLHNKITLISGNSGVGKSTIIKALEPTIDLRIGEISKYHHKGRHTTTFSTMYPLSNGGYIIDTPGIKGFGLLDIESQELYHYFPEMMKYAEGCQYYNCTHTHEPECAVRRAIEDGKVSQSRYVSYLKILEEDGKHR